MKKLLPLAVLAALSSVHVASAQAADVSAAVGATGQSGMTYRLGLKLGLGQETVADLHRAPDRLLGCGLHLLGRWR